MTTLPLEARRTVLGQVTSIVEKRFYDPSFCGRDWTGLARERTDSILSREEAPAFRAAVQELLCELKARPLRFYHQSEFTVPFHKAAWATGRSVGEGWMIQDIHLDGPAHHASLEPGDIVQAIDGRAVTRPGAPDLPVNASVPELLVRKRSGEEVAIRLGGSPPPARVRFVSHSMLEDAIGYLRISMFPGLVGVDFARDVDQAIGALDGCRALVVDLRGNPGGGSGNLRLMSYMTTARIPVGYSLTRPRAQRGYRREQLAQFRGIPSSKATLIWLALRFKFVDKSIVVVTEGLREQSFHGRVVLLVNEHTASASETVAGFVKDHKLGILVGRRTAGTLLGWSTFRLEHDYRLVIPVSNYLTWEGKCFEGTGVEPDVEVDFSADAARQGTDQQLEKAWEVARSL
jgi:carboxyl-terminal processing protease